MKKTIIFLAEGFEEIEALSVVDVLRRASIECKICSLKEKNVTGSHGIEVVADIMIDSVDINEFDCIILPGGMPGAKNLKENLKIIEYVQKFHKENKLIAAICAAPIVLEAAGIIKNNEVTSYPGVKDQLKSAVYKEEVVVSHNNIITSRGPATAIEFGLALVKALGEKEKEETLRADMLVNFLGEKIKTGCGTKK
jgi:4-methyl-5(b-hydroxyethyl)-thiazole monophosphate biosynthesis